MLLRTVTSCLLVAVLLVTRTWQQSIPGFSNVKFTVQPQDRYLLPTGSDTTFSCGAEGISNTTNSLSPIQVIVYINDVPLDRFTYTPKFFLLTEGGPSNRPTGVLVSDIQLSDNGMKIHCQVADCPKGGNPCVGLGINSTIANLVVADGRPQAIPLTQSNSTIRSITVMWSSVLVPESGPLTSYNVTLLDSQSNQTLSHELIANPVNVSEHTFADLDPETSYRVNVVGNNQYGAGNTTAEPLKITTATPQVPGPPVDVATERFPVTQILVTWMAPVIDPHKQTPVTHFAISYHPVDLPQNITSLNISADSNLQYIVPAAESDTNYSISISAVNTAGLGLPALVNIETAPTNITPSIPQQAMPQTSSANLQITSSIMPTPSFTPSSTSSITTSSLSLSTSSAAAFTSSTSSIVAVVSPTSRVISTRISNQPSRSSISNVLQSVAMETPTQPLSIPDPTAASLVIIASAAVAFVLIVVIMIIAIVLIVVCVKNMRHETAQVDFPDDLPKEWNSRHDKRSSFLKDVSSESSDSNEMSNRSSSLSQESPMGAMRSNEAEV